ncbi:MAG TPA: response regulator, partial [Gammaproteobacteria bacterium]|nr:response regulator [Gammaproteobacteria bacterium]
LRYMQEESPVFSYGGMDYNLQYMGVLLGLGTPQLSEELDTVPVLLVRAGEHSSALVTEGMLGSREIVVKSVGPQITSIRGIAGATLLGDGSIVLILDTGGLVRAAATAAALGEVQEQAERVSEEQKAEETTVAMVVDDSITVRRVTQRLLERYGMQVITAKDGVDALAVLQEQVPDVMLLDIEMPRMDGYELAGHMRNDDRFKDVPIIMITSRTGEKHRTRAMELGVNMYLGKPYQESELLEHIATLVGKFNPERTRWE